MSCQRIPSPFSSPQMRKWEAEANKYHWTMGPHENQFIAKQVDKATEHRAFVVLAVGIAVIFALTTAAVFLLKSKFQDTNGKVVLDFTARNIKTAKILGVIGGGLVSIFLLGAYYTYEFGGAKKAAQAIETDHKDQLFNALRQQGLDAVKKHADATSQHYQRIASQAQAKLDAETGGRELSSPR